MYVGGGGHKRRSQPSTAQTFCNGRGLQCSQLSVSGVMTIPILKTLKETPLPSSTFFLNSYEKTGDFVLAAPFE